MATKTLSSGYIQKNFGAVIDNVLSGTAAIVQRYSRKLAVIISYEEYRQLKALQDSLWAESKRIADKNDSEGTWVTGEEMDRLMIERGVFTAEELGIQNS